MLACSLYLWLDRALQHRPSPTRNAQPSIAALRSSQMVAVVCSARSVAARASSSTTAPAQPRSLVIDISKRKLVDSYGARQRRWQAELGCCSIAAATAAAADAAADAYCTCLRGHHACCTHVLLAVAPLLPPGGRAVRNVDNTIYGERPAAAALALVPTALPSAGTRTTRPPKRP